MEKKKSVWNSIRKDFRRNKYIYLLVVPVIAYFLIFHYKPMYGLVIVFKRYRSTAGISGSPWVGLENFRRVFMDPFFGRILKNTISISLYSILFTFPAPIVLALMLNEVRHSRFKRTVQTISYMPHFISVVVMCSVITVFCGSGGLFNTIIEFFGGERSNLLNKKSLFYLIYVGSEIWQNIGWSSIIYLAALAGIDVEQYEAAKMDGANRIQQMFYITLPGLMPTASMLLILRMGSLLSIGREKILLLYTPLTYEVADVISTYVYRKGFVNQDYSYGTAVEIFNSIVNIIMLLITNKLSKRVGQSGLF